MVNGEKSCFVIAPIGREESETRKRSDLVLECIIKPAAEKCGYKAIRADEISEPGIITTQVIQHLLEDDLVIADLTERNPNVFYELAIRHAVRKPVVQIIKHDENIPFDVVTQRTIHYDTDLKGGTKCIGDLVDQIHAVEENPEAVDSPVSTTIDLRSLRQSENPVEKSIVEIVPMLEDIRSMVQVKGIRSRDSGVPSVLLEKIVWFVNRVPRFIPHDNIMFYQDYLEFLSGLIDFFRTRVPEENERFLKSLQISHIKAIGILEKAEQSKKEKDETLKNQILIALLGSNFAIVTIDLLEALGYRVDYIALRKELISLSGEGMISLPDYVQSWRDIKAKTSIELTQNGRSVADQICNPMALEE